MNGVCGPGAKAFRAGLSIGASLPYDYTEEDGWAAIDALTSRRWPTAGGGEIDVIRWGIDTGAFTQALYDRVSRRHALLATKGDNKPERRPVQEGSRRICETSGAPIAGRRLNFAFIGNFDLKISVYEGLRSLVAGPDPAGAYRPGTLHLPDWIGEDEMRQLTAEVLIDPRDYEVAANTKRRGALVKTGERREWRKSPHQPNEALDIVVGARAMAWGAAQALWLPATGESGRPRRMGRSSSRHCSPRRWLRQERWRRHLRLRQALAKNRSNRSSARLRRAARKPLERGHRGESHARRIKARTPS